MAAWPEVSCCLMGHINLHSPQQRDLHAEIVLEAMCPCRTLPGRSSPWGSFADTLAKRLRAVGEMQQPAGADQPQTPRPGTRMQHASSLVSPVSRAE